MPSFTKTEKLVSTFIKLLIKKKTGDGQGDTCSSAPKEES